MDTQIDTAQRRAEFITGECRCHDGYKCRNLIDPDCAYHNYADDIAEALIETRRAALEEARRAISKLYDEAHTESANYYTALLDAGLALDRLREGVEGK